MSLYATHIIHFKVKCSLQSLITSLMMSMLLPELGRRPLSKNWGGGSCSPHWRWPPSPSQAPGTLWTTTSCCSKCTAWPPDSTLGHPLVHWQPPHGPPRIPVYQHLEFFPEVLVHLVQGVPAALVLLPDQWRLPKSLCQIPVYSHSHDKSLFNVVNRLF